jgi:hypothetical protein
MSIKGPVRLVSQPVAWRKPRTMSSIEDYPQPGWQQKAALWHETHKAPPRTYPRWPLWESLERTYEEQRAQQGYPHYYHPSRTETPFYDGPMGIRRHPSEIRHEAPPYQPPALMSPPPMPIAQALATPPVLPHTFPRASQPSVPLGAPQVAGYQIIGATTASNLASAGVSVGMMFLVIGAAVGVGYLYVKYPA